MVQKNGVRPLTQYEYGVLNESKRRSKDWLMLNHSKAYKHLLKKNLIK